MPADPADLARRLALTTPADTARGLTFNAMFDVIRERGGEAAAKACDPGGTARRIEFFAFPVADFLRCAWCAAERLEGQLGGWEAVFREFGRRTTTGVLASVVGRTLTTISGRSPRQLLQNAPAGYRTTVSYGDRRVTFPAETHAVFAFTGDFMHPAYHAGVLGAAAEAVGGAEVASTWRQTGPLDAVIEVRWS
jgi:uncharacterized protein (TIGR02265 family)